MKHYKIRKTPIDRTESSIERYLKSIKQYPILTTVEEKTVLKQIEQGDEQARQRLIHSCLRFVVTIAKQYQDKGANLSDLIEAGNYGLIRAIDSYDFNKSIKFITYAVWWIRKYIIKELNLQNNIIEIPEVNITLKTKIDKAIERFELENQREPTFDELSELLKVDMETLKMVSDGFLNKYEDTDLEVQFQEETSPSLTISAELNESIKQILSSTEYEVLSRNLGFDGVPYCIDDLIIELGLSKERLRQIKTSALKKLKANPQFIQLLKNAV